MPNSVSTVQVQQSIAAWLEFTLINKSTDLPITLAAVDKVLVWYKKHGTLVFTQKTGLVAVTNPASPQAGQNFVEIGFGVYAIKFEATELNTLETFTWVVTPATPGVLDFKQFTQQVDVIEGTSWIGTIATTNTNVSAISTAVTNGFAAADLDLTNIETKENTLQTTLNAVQTTVNAINNAIPSGIKTSFV